MPTRHEDAMVRDETTREVRLPVDWTPQEQAAHPVTDGARWRAVPVTVWPDLLTITYRRDGIDTAAARWEVMATVSGRNLRRDGTAGRNRYRSTWISGGPSEDWPEWVLAEAERYHPGRVDTPDGDPEGSYV